MNFEMAEAGMDTIDWMWTDAVQMLTIRLFTNVQFEQTFEYCVLNKRWNQICGVFTTQESRKFVFFKTIRLQMHESNDVGGAICWYPS